MNAFASSNVNNFTIFNNTEKGQKWSLSNKLHREDDLPAMISATGIKMWFNNNKLHRENDQPAVVRLNGDKEWYYNGERHRENDQPAYIDFYGAQI